MDSDRDILQGIYAIICKTFEKVHTISSGELGEIHHEKDRNKTEGYAAICGIE